MSMGATVTLMMLVLVLSGAAERVLERMLLPRRTAAALLTVLFAGMLLPPFVVGPVRVNLGGMVLPAGAACILLRGVERRTSVCAVAFSAVTAGLLTLMLTMVPGALEGSAVARDVVPGVAAGMLSAVAFRAPRPAVASGVLAVIGSDAAVAVIDRLRGMDARLLLGHTGLTDGAAAAIVTAAAAGCALQWTAEIMAARRVRGGVT